MTDKEKDQNQDQGGSGSDSDQQTDQTDQTSQDFEFNDSSFKRGQNPTSPMRAERPPKSTKETDS